MISVMTISGCCTTEYITSPLEMPEPITQEQRITTEERNAMPVEVLKKVILLDKRRKTLRGIIKSTHQESN